MNICTECGSPILPGKTVCDACEAMAKSLASEERSSLNRHVPVLRVIGSDRKAPRPAPAEPEAIPDDRVPGKHVELPLYLRVAAGFVLVAFAFTSFAGPISFMMRQSRQAESARLAAQARARALEMRYAQPIRARRNFSPAAETTSSTETPAETAEVASAAGAAKSTGDTRPIRVRHPET